jgi:DNA-directed RNA polymerase specialized sigma24 family protein
VATSRLFFCRNKWRGIAAGKEKLLKTSVSLERIVILAFQLLPVFRKAFLLCEIQGLTVAEAAAILRISPQAVAIRLERARKEVDRRSQALSVENGVAG